MKKLLFISILAISSLFINSTLNALITNESSAFSAYIKSVKNLALCKAYLARNKSETDSEIIESNSTKNISLEIPFVSINKYMQQFVKNIPFTPKKALKIKTKKGTFYIWASESGIICAPDPKDFNNLVDWKAKTIFDVNKDIDISPLKFTMKVDKDGKISLGKLTN